MERLRFDRFVERQLYDPDSGFYEAGGSAGGRRGDFVTSPEVGPLFGVLVGRWLDARWSDLGEPDPFFVVEAAAGRGTLARSLRAARPACASALRYTAVERSAALRAEIDLDEVAVASDLNRVAAAHVVLANELLDNLPFRMMESDGDRWRDVWVVLDDGPPRFEVGDAVPAVPLPSDAPAGTRLPWCEEAGRWVEAARRVSGGGPVLILDYGTEDSSRLIGRDWCRTYAGHERGSDPLADGPIDITTDVPFDQLPPAVTITTQAVFLDGLGLAALVEEGRRIWRERAATGDLDALRARSRVREAEALCDPEGLGGFLVAEWWDRAGSADQVGDGGGDTE